MTDTDEVERLKFCAGRWDVFSKREKGPTFSRGDCREWRDRFQEAADHLAKAERERDETRARLADVVDKILSVVEKSLSSAQSPLQAWQECHDGIRALVPLEDAYALERIKAQAVKSVINEAVAMADDEDEKRYVEARLRAATYRRKAHQKPDQSTHKEP